MEYTDRRISGGGVWHYIIILFNILLFIITTRLFPVCHIIITSDRRPHTAIIVEMTSAYDNIIFCCLCPPALTNNNKNALRKQLLLLLSNCSSRTMWGLTTNWKSASKRWVAFTVYECIELNIVTLPSPHLLPYWVFR